MTACGGTCEYRPRGGCRIKLSEPLLKFRPLSDIKNVLLHEMIHALLFLTNKRDNSPDGHGDLFKAKATEINKSTILDIERPAEGYNITITHSMFAEVEHYRQHHWKCVKCGDVIKRAMNRKPQEADCLTRQGAACKDIKCRYHMHIKFCGGEYEKIREPDGYVDKSQKKTSKGAVAAAAGGGAPKRVRRDDGQESRPITDFFNKPSGGDDDGGKKAGEKEKEKKEREEEGDMGKRREMFASAALKRIVNNANGNSSTINFGGEGSNQAKQKQADHDDDDDDDDIIIDLTEIVAPYDDHEMQPSPFSHNNDNDGQSMCPVCGKTWRMMKIRHVDLQMHVNQCLEELG
jgi:hypothetical protein